MNTAQTTHAWSADLDHSRELKQIEKLGFDMVLSWFESWRASFQLEPGRDAARQFWNAPSFAALRRASPKSTHPVPTIV